MTRKNCAAIIITLSLTFFLVTNFFRGVSTGAAASDQASKPRSAAAVQPPFAVGHPTFASPHSAPIAIAGDRVFVANTPADTVDVIDTETHKTLTRVKVGIDPVSLAVRPDGKEVWVSNHVSDSVSVIDNDRQSPTYLQVIATIQELDLQSKTTRFDEPVGIAFANNDKAYVALSAQNQIAVVNVSTRKIDKRLNITAQDPRAITVRNGRLYVIPFESNNKTQLSGGVGDLDGDLATFDAYEHSIKHNNVLSLGHVVDIIKHPKVPDRDLYVFDTSSDELVTVVDSLGTLLYGLAVDSRGGVFVAQTDARNDANGRAGTKKHGLAELENRAFLNRITSIKFTGDAAETPQFIDLEPLPPEHPEPGEALATPFAIEISEDDQTLVVSAAGSDKLITIDTDSGKILGRVDVAAVPRGIALRNIGGQTSQAWVLNAVDNSVSIVDLSNRSHPVVVETVALQDPTHRSVKRGRVAFNTASASTTGTFACASCHPDGHTDQLLWVLKTPIVTGGDQIMPRSTMPIRGLRDTAPFHWDGIPGDPYGGNNSSNIHGNDQPSCQVDDPRSAVEHLIDGGLASTMSAEGDPRVNDQGKPGALSASQRNDMANFLLSIPYPPAPRRAYTNVVSNDALEGFKLFHLDGDWDGKPRPNVCGNCHRMPFLVSTNTPGTGMDAPTCRGAYDRFLILPQGRLNVIDFDFYARVAERGIPERSVWQFSWGGRRRFDPVWDMVLEGSTGFSGSFARQLTLNASSASDPLNVDLLSALETSAQEGAIVLQAEGMLMKESKSIPIALHYESSYRRGMYVTADRERTAYTREDLISLASDGKFIGTFSARHGVKADVDHPQPALWTHGPIEKQRGRQEFPLLHNGKRSMTVSGRHVQAAAHVIIDGRRVSGHLRIDSGETIEIELHELPDAGMHLLQVQNPDGMFSNDFIFHVVKDAEAAAQWKRQSDRAHDEWRTALARAIVEGDVGETKNLRRRGVPINELRPGGGSTPLSLAARHGRLEIAKYLIKHRVNVSGTNRDGNTPLHIAAFFCRKEIVQLLLDNEASAVLKNQRGETPLDVVSSPWNQELADFYSSISKTYNLELDHARLRQQRPVIANMLRAHTQQAPSQKDEFPATDR